MRRAPDQLTRRGFLRLASGSLAAGLLPAACARLEREPPETDVLIVGSGFAGTFLALHLVRHGVRTTVLEAGPALAAGVLDGPVSRFPHASEGDLGFPIDDNRTIGLGGTSRRWNGVATRLLPTDFRTQSNFGFAADWPISYADLASHYCAAERALEVRGGRFLPDAEPERRCAYPVETPGYVSPAALFPSRGLAFFPHAFALDAGGQALRLDEAPLRRFTAAPSATLLAEHAAMRIVPADERRVAAVEARRPDGSTVVFRARHIVVAAGVVESVRLLLDSTSERFPHGIGNRRGMVGAGFNAHPRYRARLATGRPGLAAPVGVHRTYSFNDPLRREGCNSLHVDLHAHAHAPAPNVNVTLELEPAMENRIGLDPARRDGWGRPLAVLRASWTARDRRTRARGLALQHELAAALAPASAPPPPPDLRWFHPAGGCRMGGDERSGVVDRNCKVFGVDNLWIAGASVFTTSGSGNPTLTIVALALRLGDHLLARLRSP
jgi:glucose dehydrogenase